MEAEAMARMTLTLPDQLAALVAEQLPGLNVSGLLQEALRARLVCDHSEVMCGCCGARLRRSELEARRVLAIYGRAFDRLEELVAKGGTAEGAARVLKAVALEHGIDVNYRPLPRATRRERRDHVVREFVA